MENTDLELFEQLINDELDVYVVYIKVKCKRCGWVFGANVFEKPLIEKDTICRRCYFNDHVE